MRALPFHRSMFRGIAVAVVIALSIGVLSAAPAEARTKIATKAVISVSSSSVAAGQTVTVSGKLVAGKKPLKHARALLQKRVLGQSKWYSVGTAKMSKTGKFRYATVMSKNLEFRLKYKGSGKYRASTSKPKGVTVAQGLSVTSTSATTINAGDLVTLTGTASGPLAGTPVALQLATATGWATVTSATIAPNATFSVTASATQGGTLQYRVAAGGVDGLSAVASGGVAFSVYSWFNLTGLDTVTSDGFGTTTGMDIGGQHFTDAEHSFGSYWGAEYDYAEWNLSYRCTTFAATIGLDDSSPSGSTASFGAKIDSAQPIDFGSFSVGTSKQISIPVASGFRIRLFNNFPEGEGDTIAEWGDAKVLCLGQP